MTAQAPVLREHGNAYNIFILVLTIFSLALMALLVIPWVDPETRQLLNVYDNAVCVIFLIDFAYNITGARPRSAYFIRQRGWLDLLGSIPSFGFFQLTALFRLARLSRLARIRKLLGGQKRKQLVKDVLDNRGQYATFITILAAGMVLCVASILVLQFESRSPDANIKTGGDALWWARGHDHDGRLRGLLPGHDPRAPDRRVGDVRGRRDHRRPRQHPGQHPRAAAQVGRRRPRRRARRAVGRAAMPASTAAILAELTALRAEVRALREVRPPEPG